MLSVLVVSPHPSVPGGVSTFIEGMKRHLTLSAVDSFYIGSKEGETVLERTARLLSDPLRLAYRVFTQKYDVVHINPSLNAKASIRDGVLLFTLRLIGYRRTLIYFHGWDFSLQQRILDNLMLRRVAAWLLNGAGVITVLGASFRDGLIGMGVSPSRIMLTRTMFEGDAFEAIKAAPPLRARRFILFLSRFDREKGGRELMQAFAVLAPQYPDVDLVMAGAGADITFLRAQRDHLNLRTRVIFTGYIEGTDKWTYLRDCSLFALPTYYRSEGMPVVLLEAMGAGKPLLVGAAGAIRSIIRDPDNGVILDKVNMQTVEQGLRRFLDDEAYATSVGARNAEVAWKFFEARIVCAEIESLYRRVAQC